MMAGLRVGSWVMRIPSERRNSGMGSPDWRAISMAASSLLSCISPNAKDVVLAREIIEKGAFTDVSGFGDVLDGSFRKPLLCEELESGAEKALADVGATTLAAAGI